MSNYITIDEQEETGLRRRNTAYPVNYVSGYGKGEITSNEQMVLGHSLSAAGDMMAHRQISHIVRTDDTAITQAWASLLYSLAFAFAAAIITAGIVLMSWLILGGSGKWYGLAWLVIWGICVLVALVMNRGQGLHFSSAGIAHAEIKSRETVAIHAINKHVELLEKKWNVHEHGATVEVRPARAGKNQAGKRQA
jgi:hypothetical protein